MIVDDIEQNGEAALMARLDQRFEVLGSAVARTGSIKVSAVIAPIARTGKLGDRHQLDRGDAELKQVVEMARDPGKIAAFAKRADMQFIKHNLFPAAAPPLPVAPVIAPRINDFAGPMDTLGLPARRDRGRPLRPPHSDTAFPAPPRAWRGQTPPPRPGPSAIRPVRRLRGAPPRCAPAAPIAGSEPLRARFRRQRAAYELGASSVSGSAKKKPRCSVSSAFSDGAAASARACGAATAPRPAMSTNKANEWALRL